jgi:peroxiredoxin
MTAKWAARIGFIFIIAILTMAGGCSDSDKGNQLSLPDMYLPDTRGNLVNLADFKGRVLLLNFFATWCPPCREEIPEFIELQNELGPEGLVIVGISMDTAPLEEVEAFRVSQKINYQVLYAGEQGDELVTKLGSFRGIPTTFLIDREGEIVGSFTGVAPKEAWEDEIRKLL